MSENTGFSISIYANEQFIQIAIVLQLNYIVQTSKCAKLLRYRTKYNKNIFFALYAKKLVFLAKILFKEATYLISLLYLPQIKSLDCETMKNGYKM